MDILLINPNTSVATTDMMVRIANSVCPGGIIVRGATATRGAPMIVNEEQLAGSADEVVAIGLLKAQAVAGIIVGAFGDPGLATLRRQVDIPVVGICEAAMMEASAGGRRFGIATTTLDLAAVIAAKVADLRLHDLYSGIRITPGEPSWLTRDSDRLEAALGEAVQACIECDGAQAVIIGGGPLAQAATRLAPRFDAPIVAPIPAAVRQLANRLRIAGPCLTSAPSGAAKQCQATATREI